MQLCRYLKGNKMKELNKDYKRRSEILKEVCTLPDNYDIEHFGSMDLQTLDCLIKENFIDTEETQNDSPTVQEFRDYLFTHPLATVHGYVITHTRSDYRISIEGMNEEPRTLDDRSIFFEFNKGADELDLFSNMMSSWWD